VTPAALLLDLDGTLVDSEPIHRAAYREFFRARGWPVPDLSLFTGRRAEDVFGSEPGPWAGLDVAALAAEVRELVHTGSAPEPVRGALALVEAAARHGVPLGVVTSARSRWVDLAVGEGLDALHLFDVVVTAEDVVDGKPDPAGYLLACSRLGVSPSEALAVEDAPAGVRAAVAAGADQVLPDLRGVLALLT
jgi:sugar-phosphatase